jgi:adenylate cyclase
MRAKGFPEYPEGAQVNQEQWERFVALGGRGHIRGAVRLLSRLPSAPRCEACGGPFGGVGGRLMRMVGKGPSRKNPRWCNVCFELSPGDGYVTRLGILFADVRGSTALGERLRPQDLRAVLNDFYDRVTRVVLRHGLVDKLIGDEVMGIYLPPLSPGGRFIETLVADAHRLLASVGYGGPEGPILEVGVGVDVGEAFVGHVGDGEIRDFTAIGDVVNTAARLQGAAGPGQIVMRESVAVQAGLGAAEGARIELDLKGKAEPLAARVLSVGG